MPNFRKMLDTHEKISTSMQVYKQHKYPQKYDEVLLVFINQTDQFLLVHLFIYSIKCTQK